MFGRLAAAIDALDGGVIADTDLDRFWTALDDLALS